MPWQLRRTVICRAARPALEIPSGPVAAPTRAGLRFHPALIVVIGTCAALFREAMHTGLAGDAFYQLATGRWMLAHHAVIRHDVFSYTVYGKPWLVEEWGFALLLAWLVAHVGAGELLAYFCRGVLSGRYCSASLGGARLGCGWLWTACLSMFAGAGIYVLCNTPSSGPELLSSRRFCCSLRWPASAQLGSSPSRRCCLFGPTSTGVSSSGLGIVALELIWSVFPA